MNILSKTILLLFVPVLLQANETPYDLTLYAYDSFMAKGGLGPEILPIFEKKCRCKVKAIGVGNAGQLLTRLQIDVQRGKPSAQIVIGLDQNLRLQAKEYLEPWGSWKPKGFAKMVPISQLDSENNFLPFDYGVFAWMADLKELKRLNLKTPHTFDELLTPEWKRNILLEDPRVSAPGLAFLIYTRMMFKSKTWDFWKKFRSQWLTLTPGWKEAYGLFLKGEAPLVWSYTTSQAYHTENGDHEGRYQALVFEEGQPVQIEGAALVKSSLGNTKTNELAHSFLEFLLSKEVQEKVPLKNYMLPVIRGTRLPESFRSLPVAKHLYKVESSEKEISETLKTWSRVVSGVQ